MKTKTILTSAIIIAATAITTAFATPEPQKIAVVDIQKIVMSSPQVKILKAEQESKSKDIQAYIKKAQADIKKQTDENKKKTLIAKYEKELNAKKEANAKTYKTKLKAADESITKQIGQKASEMGYTMVIPKSSVIYGGDDITDAIIKVIK